MRKEMEPRLSPLIGLEAGVSFFSTNRRLWWDKTNALSITSSLDDCTYMCGLEQSLIEYEEKSATALFFLYSNLWLV